MRCAAICGCLALQTAKSLTSYSSRADGTRESSSACGDSGGRARHAILAAKPHKNSEATFEYRWQGHDARADGGATPAADTGGAHLDSHQRRTESGCF